VLETDVSTALLGSATWQSLPSSGRGDAPIRLLVRRPLDAGSSEFRFAAIGFDVLYARRVDVEVFDNAGRVAAGHTVSDCRAPIAPRLVACG